VGYFILYRKGGRWKEGGRHRDCPWSERKSCCYPPEIFPFLEAGLAVAGAVIGAGAASGGGGYTCGKAAIGR